MNLKLDKLNRIAVLLAGDFRQWPRAAEYIFAFAEQQAVTVDYYFATWTTTQDYWYTSQTSHTPAREIRQITENDITCEFLKHNKNLINFQLVGQLSQLNTIPHSSDITFYYQTYLAKLANIMKRRYELDNNFVYDQVFEMRPDLYIFNDTITSLSDFEWSGELHYYEFKHHQSQCPVASDVYYQANSFSNDILAERFYYKKSTNYSPVQIDCHGDLAFINNHWILFDYIHLRRLRPVTPARPITQVVIRPNFPQDDLRNYSQPQLWEYFQQYNNLVHQT